MFAGLTGGLMLASVLPVSVLGAASYSQELQEAYTYAYSKGITTMSPIDNANMYGELTRGQLAKMIANWAEKEMGTKVDTTAVCSFSDAHTAEGDLATYVKKACQMGLMGQGIDKFRPNDKVTRGEFGTTLSRALWGDKYNGATPFYKNHLEALRDAGIMKMIDTPNQMEIRGYVMLMLMRSVNVVTPSECKDPAVILACALGGDSCPARCKDKNPGANTGTNNTAGDLNINVVDYSNQIRSVPMVGISIFNAIKFDATNDVTVNSVTLERVGLSSRSDIKGVWFEKDGIAVSSRGTVATDGKVMTNFNKGFKVKSSETLDLVVELSGASAGAEVAFKFIGVDSTAKNAVYNAVTSTYRTAKYDVAALDFSNVGGTGDVVYKLGNQSELTFGQFKVSNQAKGDDRNVFLKSVTFRNNGTADLNSLLKNVKVMRDNKVVSKSVSMDGRNITITLEDTINAGKAVVYTVMGEVASLERVGDTVQLELRKDRDLVAYEASTKFRTTMNKAIQNNSWIMKNYRIDGGRVTLTNTAAFPKTVDAGSGSSDVVIADGTLTVAEPIKLPKMTLAVNNTGVVRSLVLEIGGSRYASTVNGTAFVFEDVYVNKTASIKLIASLESLPAHGSVQFVPTAIGSLAFGSAKGEYTNNSEDLKGNDIAGAVQIAKINVKEAQFTLKNKASSTQKVTLTESSNKIIFDGEMVAPKGDINVTEVTLSGLNATGITDSSQIDLQLYINDTPVSNATYRRGNNVVTFYNVGTATKTPSKFRIEATPTMTQTGDFVFDVVAKGTDTNGNTATTAAVKTVKLSVVESSNVSVANANAVSQVVNEGSNAELTKFTLSARNGSINLTGLKLNYSGSVAALNGQSVTVEVNGNSYTATSTAAGVEFTGLNVTLNEGNHNVVFTTNINTDGQPNGVAVEVASAEVKGDFPTVTKAINSKYLFVKAFPKLSVVSAKDNQLVVKIENVSDDDITITDYVAVNADPTSTTLNGQSVTSPIPVGKQVTLAKGQSTELKMNITAAWTLKLTGLKYQVVDGTPYNYTVNDNYTNIATWGTLQVVYKS